MKNAPTVDAAMSAPLAKENLQKAINSLFALYEDIGKLPYSMLSQTHIPGIDGLREWHQKAESYLAVLATDDIPF